MTTSGTCMLCGYSGVKAAMTRHLKTCSASRDEAAATSPVLHLRVEGAYDPTYWLDLEVAPDATLHQLDRYLRQVWLECCGHMSAFFDGRAELGKNLRLSRAFRSVGKKVAYQYDFGSTTALTLGRGANREAPVGKVQIRLLARNDPPNWSCTACDEPATLICSYCNWEGEAFYCDKHARDHDCYEDGAFLPVVNSPRMGVCGYTG